MPAPLSFVYDGWDGYQESLVSAIKDLTPDQLTFRAVEGMNSVGELALHIADGRVEWFRRMGAPLSAELWVEISSRAAPPSDGPHLAAWLNQTWRMVEETLSQWSTEDLSKTYEHVYQGKTYAVSRQWTIWRILTHDVHHGGQLSELLAIQGIEPMKLTLLGGHLAEPPVLA